MIAAFDVDYRPNETVTAKLIFDTWSSATPMREDIHRVPGPAEPYQAGRFFERELPHILASLGTDRPDVIVVDGYVWLAKDRPGLGMHLHDATKLPIVGVAKEAFRGNDIAIEVVRGQSKHPLYVTAIGLDAADAARSVAMMDGPHRIPTLLKRVDHLCRTS